MDYAKKLAALLSGSIHPQQPTPQTLGTGMAGQAAQALDQRAYQMHLLEAQAMGQQPMTPEQFAAQQR